MFRILAIFLVLLIPSYFIAEEFQRIAAMKGHFEARYFWCSFFLGIVGWLMVIALPDHSDKVYYYPTENEETNSNDNMKEQ